MDHKRLYVCDTYPCCGYKVLLGCKGHLQSDLIKSYLLQGDYSALLTLLACIEFQYVASVSVKEDTFPVEK